MAKQQIQVYSDALFELAQQQNITAEYAAAMRLLTQLWQHNEALRKCLASPVIEKAEKYGLLERLFANCIPGDVVRFLKLLCQKNHIAQFEKIAAAFEKKYLETNNIRKFTVTSAFAIDEPLQKKLIQKLQVLTGAQILLETKTDRAVIGGLLLESDGTEIDATIQTNIETFRQSLFALSL